MARRRKQEEESSLDLLLDTVCNAFGGIIFIVLLLSVLPSRNSAAEDSKDASAAQLAELARLRIEIEQEERLEKLQQNTSSALATQDAEKELQQKKLLETKKAALRNTIDARSKTEVELNAALSKESSETSRLAALKSRLEAAIVKGEQERNAQEIINTRLPRLRSIAGKRRYFLIVYENRVYLTFGTGAQSHEIFPNEQDLKVSSEGRGKTFVPLAGRGMPVGEWIKSPNGAAKFRGQFSEHEWVINICLYPDSVDQFNPVRNAFTERGYDYNWHPITSDRPLKLFPASGPAEAL
jgi:hypothetical protein